jgi:twinkle protein
MKIVSLKTKIQYEIAPIRDTENQMPCPECSSQRKHQKAKSFSWNNTKMTGYCFNCEASFVEYKPFKDEKKYVLPTINNKTGLTEKAMSYFLSRGINQNTVNEFKIYSDTEWMPQFEKEVEVFCFPYYYDGNLINVKYRGANKTFKLHKDSELIFYNQDCILKFESIIIVEGEIDCLSIYEAGFKNVISVPNGANKNLQYLDSYYHLFENKKIVIATDNDLKGVELKDELIRRFGAENCMLVEFKDCKDANEYLTTYGRNELKKIVDEAKNIPIEGIINLEQNYKEIYNMFLNGIEEGKKIGVESFDKLVTWELGRVATWTGIPGHGKSEIVDWICMLLNLRYGWKIGYFSPENYPIKWHYRKIAEKLFGKQFNSNNMTTNDFNMIFNYVENNYDFIYPEEDFTFENIMKKAEYLVKSKGIKIFVIDPYNKIEHKREKSETETEYISRFLDAVTTFAKKNNVLLHLVAHPRKMPKNSNGTYEKPNLYDINGSANFYNKTDYGFSVYRYFDENPHVEIDVLKVKFKHLGDGGQSDFHYNHLNGRLEEINTFDNDFDNSSWVTTTEKQNEQIKPNENFDNNDVPF